MQKCLGQILCCRWTEVAVAPDAIDIYVCHAYTVCTVLYCTVLYTWHIDIPVDAMLHNYSLRHNTDT